jgi:Beta-propeller repeat
MRRGSAILLVIAQFTGCAWMNPEPEISTADLQYGQVLQPRSWSFEINRGQARENIKYLSRSGELATLLTSNELVLVQDAGKAGVCIRFSDSHHDAAVTTLEKLPGLNHYLTDPNPENWITDVPHFARLRYHEVYPGVDIEFYGKQGSIAFDFLVSPGHDPSNAKLSFSGITGMEIDDGHLVLTHPAGQVALAPPVIYQEGIDGREIIPGAYRITGDKEAGFAIGRYDTRNDLIIDPVITWSTYAGGSGTEIASAMALDPSGNIYITGTTSSTDLPLSGPYQSTLGGFASAHVMKFDAVTHDLVYSTYLGDKVQESRAIAVDSNGNAYVGGSTASTTWPTVNPIQATNGGLIDAFATKLNAAGNGLIYSTYIGGQGIDRVRALALDTNNRLYLTGPTSSSDFPLVNAWQSTLQGYIDTWVGRINPTGNQLEYSTLLGGNSNDYGAGIVADAPGNAYIAGFTGSSDFPVVTPIQANNAGSNDVYVAMLDTTGSVSWATYLGGSESDTSAAIKITETGELIVTGGTRSADFPTQNATQAIHGGETDAFLLTLDSSGTALSFSTYLGGTGGESANAISIGASNTVYLTGTTASTDFPHINAVQATYNGGISDAFVTRLDLTVPTLLHSTYLGGNDEDRGRAIATDADGNTHIGGMTHSTDFPLLAPYQASHAGEADIFLTTMSDGQGNGPMPDGDLNSDDIVNAADVLIGLRILSGNITATSEQMAHGDVAPFINGISAPDGVFDAGDLLGILRKSLGQTGFP